MNYENSVSLFSDIHIHPHSLSMNKLEDCINCLEWIYKESVKRKIPYIIFAGDLFHDRHRINIFAYNKTYDILDKYSDKIQSYFLVGNHDMFYRSSHDVTSIKPFSGLVKVINKPTTMLLGNVPIDFLPYSDKHPRDELKKIKKKSSILVGHISITGAILNSLHGTKYREDGLAEEITETPLKAISDYKRAFLGHFHSRQRISKRIEYLGSPLQLSFGEAMDKKGFTIFDLSSFESEFIENNFTAKYYILPYDTDFTKYNLDNSYVKIVTPQSSKIDHINIKEELMKKFKPNNVEIKMVSSDNDEIQVSEEMSGIEDFANNAPDIINSFVQSVETDLDKDKLAQIGIKITQTLDQDIEI